MNKKVIADSIFNSAITILGMIYLQMIFTIHRQRHHIGARETSFPHRTRSTPTFHAYPLRR